MMQNISVALSEETLHAVRLAAAQDGISASMWVERLVSCNVDINPDATEAARLQSQRDAMARFLAAPKYKLTDENGRAPSKEWMNDRESLRRFEHPDLHEGFAQSSEIQALRNVAEPPPEPWDYGTVAPSDK